MAGSGVYPKIDGDIWYGYDANIVNPKIIGNVGSTISNSGSATAYVNGPTISYNAAGSIQPQRGFLIQHLIWANNINATTNARIVISGAGLNNMVLALKTHTAGGTTVYPSWFFNVYVTNAALVASGGNIGSAYDFITQTQSNANIGRNHEDFTVLGY